MSSLMLKETIKGAPKREGKEELNTTRNEQGEETR